MSLGGGKTQSTTDVRLNSIAVNQSSYGNAIPLAYGQNRIPLTLLWYGNFVATPHTTTQSGGKGGSGGSSNTTYTYSASMIMGLCEGPIFGIGNVYQDKVVTTIGAVGLTLFNGAGGQATWSYLTTNFSAQAIPYDHMAYLAVANYQLGSSAALPNFTFELTGFLPFNAGTINDAEPSAILINYCTDVNHGANFNSLGTIQGAGSTYQSYCMAMGFFVSPFETTQRAAVDFIKEMLRITNSDAFMSAGVLNIVPYADTAVTGNGRTYTPNLSPLFSFTDDDYVSTGDPIIVSRVPLAETFNTVRIEFLDRSNAYNTAIAEATDAQDIALNGVRVMSTINFHQITTVSVARQVAQLILQRQLYIRSTFAFSVRADYCLLEPMDLVSITDVTLGIVNKLVRITKIDDDDHDQISITAEDMLVGTASAPLYNWQAAQGYAANYGVAPPSVLAPYIFNGPPLLVSAAGGYELWIAVDQNGAGSWGGCDVYMSLDNTSYIYAGTVNGAARYGTLTATLANHTDPDTVDTASAALTNAATTTLQLVSGSASDYANLRTLIMVDGEMMAYQTVALTSAGHYNLTNLRRGLYGSVASSHANGTQFARIDAGIFRVPFDVGMMGQTVYFKFCSFNIYQKAYQSLGAVTAYSHVLSNVNAGQNMPGPLTLIGSGVTTASNTAFKSVNTAAWDSSVYSTQSYANGCSANCYPATTLANFMLGLTVNPSASNSYTNLNYALYATTVPDIRIYESGTLVGVFAGAYTTSTLLNITYDGKHIAYYIGGALVRTVPISQLTLFMQLAFFSQNDSAYGIDYIGQSQATTPFTLVPMTNNVACVGSRSSPNGLGTNATFGVRNFQSAESLTGGCMMSFSLQGAGQAQFCGLSAAPATGGGYGVVIAGWYPHSDVGGTQLIFNGAVVGSLGANSSASDVFTITYDNFYFRWFRNNALVLQQPYTNAGPLYLFGDSFYTNALPFTNLAFLPYSSSTPQQFIARGNHIVSDTNVTKTVNDGAWTTGDAYSINGFATCHVVFKATQTNAALMVALVSGAPPSTPNYTGLTYAMQADNAGIIEIYESGTQVVANAGSYATTDYLALTYDGATLNYLKNGISLRSVSVASLTLFADVVFANGGSINSLEFGPGADIPLLDTAQVGANAATDYGSTNTSTTVTHVGSISPGTAQFASYAVANYPYPIQLTWDVVGQYSYTGATTGIFEIQCDTSSGGINKTLFIYTPVGTSQGPFISSVTFNLAANVGAFTVYWEASKNASGDTLTLSSVTARAQVVKR